MLAGLDVVEQPPRVLALSVSDAAEDVIAVVRAGARGYVTKTIDAGELLEAHTGGLVDAKEYDATTYARSMQTLY